MKKILLTLFLVVIIQLFFISTVVARGNPPGGNPPGGSATCEEGEFCNPLGSGVTPQILMGRIINAVLGIVGSIALVMFIYGGFSWMTAAGNQEAVTKGRNILIWATVGLIVIFSAYALVKFVFTAIGG